MIVRTGTAPEAGLDIEPDNPTGILVDIVFRRCQFLDNNASAAASLASSSSLKEVVAARAEG